MSWTLIALVLLVVGAAAAALWWRGEQQKHPRGTGALAPWAAVVAPGVVLKKNGALLAAYEYRGPDVDSATRGALLALTHGVNRALTPLGNEWLLHIDLMRREAQGYPAPSASADPVAAFLDEQRRRRYNAQGKHYESRSVLTLTWWPRTDRSQKFLKYLYTNVASGNPDWDRELRRFEQELARVENSLSPHIGLERLSTAELVQYLHAAATGDDHPIRVPPGGFFLDEVVGYPDFYGGYEPQIGPYHLGVLSIDGYPATAHPAICAFLQRLACRYRWCIRWRPFERLEAEHRTERARARWFRGRKSFRQWFYDPRNETDFDRWQDEASVSGDKLAMVDDAKEAVAEASSGLVGFGELTNTIVVFDEDRKRLVDTMREVQKQIGAHGFTSRIEDVNAVEAFLGTWPGEDYRNRRELVMHSVHLSDIMPTTSVYVGEASNPSPMFPAGTPPLFIAATSGATPYRGNLHVQDVGHAIVVGPTGGGKSTMLGLLAEQWLARYADLGAQVFVIDRGYSAYPLGTASHARAHYDLTAEGRAGDPSFAPLARVDEPRERVWAGEWLEALFALNGVDVTPQQREAIAVALSRLAEKEPGDRTLLRLLTLLQDFALRDGLRPYTAKGDHGYLFDAPSDSLTDANVHVFEISRLLHAGDRIVAPVLSYLFHAIDRRMIGPPTLVAVDEAWVALMRSEFAQQVRQWLKEARKRNGSIVLSTQSLADFDAFQGVQAIYEACPTRFYLPNPEAQTPGGREFYTRLGLNERELEIVATMTPKRDYYVVSPRGRREIDFELGPVELAFVGAGAPEDRGTIDDLRTRYDGSWPAAWLESRGLGEAAAELTEKLVAGKEATS